MRQLKDRVRCEGVERLGGFSVQDSFEHIKDPARMSGEDLLKARAEITLALSELDYRPAFGSGGGNPKTVIRQQLNAILAAIEQELAERDGRNSP